MAGVFDRIAGALPTALLDVVGSDSNYFATLFEIFALAIEKSGETLDGETADRVEDRLFRRLVLASYLVGIFDDPWTIDDPGFGFDDFFDRALDDPTSDERAAIDDFVTTALEAIRARRREIAEGVPE